MIRTFKNDDLDVCAQLYVDAFSAPPWNESLTIETAKERINFLFTLPNAVGKIDERNGKILGYWMGYIEPLAGTKELGIKEVVVAPDAQGMGIGKGLMKNAEEYARANRCTKASLWTSRDPKQFGFYSGLGYAADGSVVSMSKQIPRFPDKTDKLALR